jgi:hypothetical protein
MTSGYEFSKRLDEYKTKNIAYSKNIERVEEDFGVAIGLFTKRLTTTIRTEVEGLIRLEVDQLARTKYENMLRFIFERYGPRNISDIETLKTQLRRTDDSQGYKYLLYMHRHVQNQLSKILRRDPLTGEIVNNTQGLPVTYEFSQEELRSIIMEQLINAKKLAKLVLPR